MADNSSTGFALYICKIPDIHERRSQSRSKLLCSVRGKRYIVRVKAEFMWSGAIIDSSYAEVDIAKEGLLDLKVWCVRSGKTWRSNVATKHSDLANHHCRSQQQQYCINSKTAAAVVAYFDDCIVQATTPRCS